MKRLLIISSMTLLLGAACDNDPAPDPCEGVTCSDHGTCLVDADNQAYCDCDTCYAEDGLTLPFTRKSLWGSIVTPEGVALTHQLQRSVSLPHDLMAWRRIIFTTEVAAELRHQPHRAA